LPGSRPGPAAGEARLRGLLDDYLGHDSFTRAAEQLRAFPVLLGDEADAILADLAEAAHRRDDGTELRLRQQLAFLRRCRRDGLDHVFQAGSPDIDPTVVAGIRAEMASADAAEARFDATGQPEALRAAGDTWRSIAAQPDLEAAFPALRAALLNNAGGVLLRCAWVEGGDAELAPASGMLRQAVALTPPGSQLLAGRLANLGIALRESYRRSADPPVLQDALRTLRAAVAASPDSPGLAAAHGNLALALEELYLRDGDPAHLDEAVAGCESALRDPEVDPRQRTDLLQQLGNTLRRRYEARDDAEDLDRAVEVLDQAVAATPVASPMRHRPQVDLGIALADRHARRGDPQDLARAIESFAAAARTVGPASPDRPGCLVHLGLGHYRRYQVAGTLDDLDRAVALLDEAVRSSPSHGVDAPAWAVNLATVLQERARLAGTADDLDRAIGTLETASSMMSAGSPHRPAYLTNLGNALRDRYQATGDSGDLDAAVAAHEQALAAAAPRAADRRTLQANLGVALWDRYQLTGSAGQLDRAVALLDEAAAVDRPGDADQPRRLVALARALADRYDLAGDDQDRVDALANYAEGCAQGLHNDPESTLQAAERWGAWAAGQGWWDQAATAYGVAMTALRTAVRVQVVREYKESWLRRGARLGAHGAQALAAVGRLPDAVQELEAGRGVLLAEALDRDRADLRQLASGDAELAVRYREAAQRVQALEQRSIDRSGGPPDGPTPSAVA
jgi:hypothetical protein